MPASFWCTVKPFLLICIPFLTSLSTCSCDSKCPVVDFLLENFNQLDHITAIIWILFSTTVSDRSVEQMPIVLANGGNHHPRQMLYYLLFIPWSCVGVAIKCEVNNTAQRVFGERKLQLLELVVLWCTRHCPVYSPEDGTAIQNNHNSVGQGSGRLLLELGLRCWWSEPAFICEVKWA